MKAFHLSIRTDNAAFADGAIAYGPDEEIARILRQVADRIISHGVTTYRHAIHDGNGNKVGSYNTEA